MIWTIKIEIQRYKNMTLNRLIKIRLMLYDTRMNEGIQSLCNLQLPEKFVPEWFYLIDFRQGKGHVQ